MGSAQKMIHQVSIVAQTNNFVPTIAEQVRLKADVQIMQPFLMSPCCIVLR